LLSCPLEDSDEIPRRLIRSVARTEELLAIEDVAEDRTWVRDTYFATQPPRSLLCIPIVRQGQVVGILYLENQTVKGAFTRDRVQVLNLLCAQAAISLENAQLYQQAQQALTDLQNAQLQLVQSEKMSALATSSPGSLTKSTTR